MMRLGQSKHPYIALLIALCTTCLAANAVSAQAPSNQAPVIEKWSPLRIPIGTTTFTVYGNNFSSDAVVKLEGTPLPTTFVSSTELQVFSFAAGPISGNITVTNPGTPEMMSQPRLIEFGPAPRIEPDPATLVEGITEQFVTNVTGSSDKNVQWFVDGGAANGRSQATVCIERTEHPPLLLSPSAPSSQSASSVKH